MQRYDLLVLGAGIVGLAAARELLFRYSHLRLAVLDKEHVVGHHQTGHNSGVIHSGVYYTPGSLKAKLCVEGSRELYAYCEQQGIATERRGKVIVASKADEVPRLKELFRRGQANGVEGLELIGPERLAELEPHCVGVQALWSPNTGIVDYGRVAHAYAREVRSANGEVLLGQEVQTIERSAHGVSVQTTRESFQARYLIACAGLYADRVARLTEAPQDPRIVPFRGDYWVLRPERRYLVNKLIYPVPDPKFPFLGVHFTPRIGDGAVWLGPNAVLAFSREGYGRLDTNVADLIEVVRYGGFRRLAQRYWRTGAAEMARDFRKDLFLNSLRQYVPELVASDLLPGPSGVRAQALDRSGRLVDDFIVNVQDRQIIHVRNAPSPAATSSLAIGRLIADAAGNAFGLDA